eukprot:8761773-Ditylum_brightwellii.AAC.1
MKEDTQSPVSAPASIPDATLQQSKRTNVNQGAENKESDATLQRSKRINVKQGAEYRKSNFDAQYDKYYGTQGTQHLQAKYKQGF